MRALRLHELGQVQKRDAMCIRNKILKMELPNNRKIGWPKRRFLDVLRAAMQVVGVTEKDAEDKRQEFSDAVTLSLAVLPVCHARSVSVRGAIILISCSYKCFSNMTVFTFI